MELKEQFSEPCMFIVIAKAVVLCVLPLCRPHPLSVSVLCLPLSTAHTWPASAHQLPFKYTSFPCSCRQIVLRYTVVVIRTWLQYTHFPVVLLLKSRASPLFSLLIVLWIYTSSLPASLPPAWCSPLSNLPPASLLVTPNKPVHLHYNSCTLCVLLLGPTLEYVIAVISPLISRKHDIKQTVP